MDKALYESIPAECRPPLEEIELVLRSANGEILPVYGQAEMTLSLGEYTFNYKVKVVSLGDKSAILGLDFMDDEECVLYFRTGILEIGEPNRRLKLHRQNGSKCAKIVVAKSLCIPANHEILVSGKITQRHRNFEEPLGTVEQTNSLPEKTGLFVARSLVNTSNSHVPVRIANFTDETVRLDTGHTIALLHPVDPDCVRSIDEFTENNTNFGEVNRITESESNDSSNELPTHLQPLVDGVAPEASENERKLLSDLLIKYKDSFQGPDGKLGRTNLVSHRIETNCKPIKQRLRTPPIHMQDAVDAELDRMIKHDIIEPSESPWSSPLLAIKKKSGDIRLCADLRKLNDALINKDAYPLPKIDECLDTLSGSNWFSTLDLASGYYQVPLHENDKEKTAFSTRKGHFQYVTMPFGLANSPSSFERLMEICLRGLQWKVACLYLDDVICFGRTYEEAIANLDSVIGRFQKANLVLKTTKCKLVQTSVEFLGHIVSHDGIATDPSKIEAV